ncbi:MAG: DUF1549 and DUF1553 domain-containing protein [Planctomycetaceae bacterium]
MKRMTQVCCLTLLATLWGAGFTGLTSQIAADDLFPASQRFANAKAEEVPDFQRHLVPLLGKLGCNGRACHGSFQGRGDFRLSLFGYDFKMDHDGLKERLDTDKPAESFALQKATLTEAHEGGKRMDVGSWEYNLFLRWIEGGALPRPEAPASLTRLEVTPSEILFRKSGEQQQLKCVAVWSDGVREDVTCLTRFISNDEVIADVTDQGLVTNSESGDTHIVAFYDTAVIPIPVIRPVSDQFGDNYPAVATRTPIDTHVVDKLRKLGVIPADLCDDAEFLRRVSLDLTGTLPTAAQVRAFLADTSPDKRQQKIDELLETPAYAAWWTTKLCDWTGCNDNQLNNVNPVARQSGSTDWYNWIESRVAKNVPYDELMEGIVVAQSRLPGESYREYCERQSDYYRKSDGNVAEQPGLIYYWGRQNFRTDEDRAIGFAYTFMGTRIQCAQCHKHPFDVWTKDDFDQFKEFFNPTRITFAAKGADQAEYNAILKELGADVKSKNGNDQRKAIAAAINDGKTIPFPELVVKSVKVNPNARNKDSKVKGKDTDRTPPKAEARLLGSTVVDMNAIADPRTALMDWLRHDEKQLFAKAFVNRAWANFFNRGIVEPTDDLSVANPPCNDGLMDYLSRGFVENKYDMKWVHREICNSDTYQRSWRPNTTNAGDERNFSRAVVRRLPAEVAYDALQLATLGDDRAATYLTDLKGRAVAIPGVGRNATQGPNYALTVFGRSLRESNCDCDRSSEASLLQVVFTRNDQDVLNLLNAREGWITQSLRGVSNGTTTSGNDAKGSAQRLEALKTAVELNERRVAKAEFKNDAKLLARAKSLLQESRDALEAYEKSLRPVVAAERSPATGSPSEFASKLVEEAFLRTVSRFPTDSERVASVTFLQEAKDQTVGLRDLMWSLINTKEFIVNH